MLIIILFALVALSYGQNICPEPQWKKWSTLFPQPPAQNTVVNITEKILFDKSTPNFLGGLNILAGGGLYFDPAWLPSAAEPVLQLRSRYIIVPTDASFVIGCASQPWAQPAEVVIYGNKTEFTASQITANPGVKFIAIRGGLFQIQVLCILRVSLNFICDDVFLMLFL